MVLVLVVTAACVTTVGVWFARTTVKASEGGATPTAAASAVMTVAFSMASDDSLDGITRYLDSSKQDEVVSQLRKIRADLAHGGMWLEVSPDFTESQHGSTATVTLKAASVFAAKRGTQTFWYTGSPLPWTFTVRKSRNPLSAGWKVVSIEAPDPCTQYVKCGN